jgi:hypothetical protein
MTLTNLKNPIEELRVLIHLMELSRDEQGAARLRLPFGVVNQVLLRRLRALIDRCADDVAKWDKADAGAFTELRDAYEDDAAKC